MSRDEADPIEEIFQRIVRQNIGQTIYDVAQLRDMARRGRKIEQGMEQGNRQVAERMHELQADAEAQRLRAEAAEAALAELRAAAIDALDEVEGWPHGPAYEVKQEPYDAAIKHLRDLAELEDAPAPALMLTTEEAWERDRHVVGEAVHNAWMAEKQRQGFADHPYVPGMRPGAMANYCLRECGIHESRHHPDMLPYEDLTPENQAYDYASGEVAYRLGWQARGSER